MIYVKGAPNAWHTTVPPQVLVLSFPFKKKKKKGVNATQLLKVRFLYINSVNVLEKVLFYQSLLLVIYFTIHLAGDNTEYFCTKNFTSGKVNILSPFSLSLAI